jgi:single-strand DNA-binding protein
MQGMNKIMLIGNLGKDPDLSYTANGKAFVRFTMAVKRRVKSGEQRDSDTDWFNITAWENLAEICSKFLHKGSKVYIEGRVQQRKYTDKNGVDRTAFDVVATDMEMLTPKSQETGSGGVIDDDLANLDDQPF